jgi:hypothetical protein
VFRVKARGGPSAESLLAILRFRLGELRAGAPDDASRGVIDAMPPAGRLARRWDRQWSPRIIDVASKP